MASMKYQEVLNENLSAKKKYLPRSYKCVAAESSSRTMAQNIHLNPHINGSVASESNV